MESVTEVRSIRLSRCVTKVVLSEQPQMCCPGGTKHGMNCRDNSIVSGMCWILV